MQGWRGTCAHSLVLCLLARLAAPRPITALLASVMLPRWLLLLMTPNQNRTCSSSCWSCPMQTRSLRVHFLRCRSLSQCNQAVRAILKLTEKEFDVKCSLIRVRDINQLAKCKNSMSSATSASRLPRPTRMSSNTKKQINGTFMMQPSTKQEMLQDLHHTE